MKTLTILITILVVLISGCSQQSVVNQAAAKPNVLFIIVDDLGMADLGSFGGEIDTPNLDKLAYNGVRLTSFYAAPTCSPSRAMLLTGVDSHIAGLGNMKEELSPNQKGQPGYEGYLNNRVVSLASLLNQSGYNTYLTGKWHLGESAATSPAARGFDKSFSLMAGGASHFSDMQPAYAPSPEIKAMYYDGNQRLDKLPDNFHYSSQFFVDQLIKYIDEDKDNGKPFFGILSFTAPHWPLQAPDEAIAKYHGNYDDGYDKLLEQRFEKQKKLGIIPPHATLNRNTNPDKAWLSLNNEQRKVAARAMEVYAAMVDQLDLHVGRLLDYLADSNQLDNTLIVFLSDNGAEGHDLDETWPMEDFPKIRTTINTTHDFSYENMGKQGSYVLYGADWARAGAPAYKLYKAFPTEGGMRVAAFAHYPKLLPKNVLSNQVFQIQDIVPTILDFVGSKHPQKFNGKEIKPATGISMLPYLSDQKKPVPKRVLAFELFGKRMVLKHPWKLLHLPKPWGTDQWQLYNIEQDTAESKDMAKQFPQKVTELKAHWQQYQKDNNVIIPDWVSGY